MIEVGGAAVQAAVPAAVQAVVGAAVGAAVPAVAHDVTDGMVHHSDIKVLKFVFLCF